MVEFESRGKKINFNYRLKIYLIFIILEVQVLSGQNIQTAH